MRVPIEALADSISALRAARVVSVELGDVELGEPHDTIPAPATVRDRHDEIFPPEACSSDRIAVANGWIESPGEPEEFARGALTSSGVTEPECEVLLCAGANVGEHFRVRR